MYVAVGHHLGRRYHHGPVTLHACSCAAPAVLTTSKVCDSVSTAAVEAQELQRTHRCQAATHSQLLVLCTWMCFSHLQEVANCSGAPSGAQTIKGLCVCPSTAPSSLFTVRGCLQCCSRCSNVTRASWLRLLGLSNIMQCNIDATPAGGGEASVEHHLGRRHL
jgi:hypothetical protein